MSESLPPPQTTQRRPAEWDGLVAIAQPACAPGVSRQGRWEVAGQLWTETQALPFEVDDRCLYYGIGKTAACAIAQSMATEEGRARFVDHTARRFVRAHVPYLQMNGLSDQKDAGLFIGEIRTPGFMSRDLSNPRWVRRTYETQPGADRLVTDMLLESVRDHGDPSWSLDHDAKVKDFHVERALKGGGSFDYTMRNTIAVAAHLLSGALALRAGLEPGHPQKALIPIKDVPGLDAAQLRSLVPAPVSVKVASLRADVATYDIAAHLSLNESGSLALDPAAYKHLAQTTQHIAVMPSGLRHEKRIGCPAMFVGDLVPLASALLPEAVLSAQNMLRSRRISDVVMCKLLGIGA